MKRYAQTLVLITAISALAGAPHANAQQQTEQQQQQAPADLVLQLNLTPEQREKIRSIREQTKAERAGINERVRQANLALETALDADNPDETLVEQKLREVNAAQAAQMRMRILTEVKIRRVLTLEQLGVLKTLRQQARQARRGGLSDNSGVQGRRGLNNNQRNAVGPLFPRRALQRRQRP